MRQTSVWGNEIIPIFILSGEPVHAYQDPGRLLLLRQRSAGQPASACVQLRQHGTGHDRGHQVRVARASTEQQIRRVCVKLVKTRLLEGAFVFKSEMTDIGLRMKHMENSEGVHFGCSVRTWYKYTKCTT